MKQSILLLLILFLIGCSDTPNIVEQSFLKNDKLSEKQKLVKLLDVDYLKNLGLSDNEIKWLRTIYNQNNFKLLFSQDSKLKDIAFDLQYELNHSIWYGIPNSRIIKPLQKMHPLEKEVILTLNFGRMISDLNNGFFDFENKKMKEYKPAINLYELLKQLDTISFTKIFLKQGPIDTNYRYLAYNIYHYGKNHIIDTNKLQLKTIKENPKKGFDEAKSALIKKGRLFENADSIDFVKSLKEFQLENGLDPDGKLGKNTIYALNESTYDKMLRASLALDRLRNKKGLPEKFIRINIPEFMLYFYAKDTLRNSHRIIVGKQENQTPQLESKISRIICYPYWKVPTSIANKELLPAVKANRNYLAKNHFKIYKSKDQEVNPLIVNWGRYSTFPFTAIQQPGTFNSLGVIKFEFQNSFSVYVHDTPKKNLFNTVFRSYSHGCMRCEKPIELAKEILTYDSIRKKGNPFPADTLDTLLLEVKNRTIPLLQSIPIFVVYETVISEKNKLTFHLDLYRREEELVKILKKGK